MKCNHCDRSARACNSKKEALAKIKGTQEIQQSPPDQHRKYAENTVEANSFDECLCLAINLQLSSALWAACCTH